MFHIKTDPITKCDATLTLIRMLTHRTRDLDPHHLYNKKNFSRIMVKGEKVALLLFPVTRHRSMYPFFSRTTRQHGKL